MNIITKTIGTDYCELVLGSLGDELCLCDWKYRSAREAIDNRLKTQLNREYVEGTSPIIEKTIKQLNEYFSSQRKVFDLPLLLVGTEFQKQIWNELIQIPYGETKSYLQLSKKINNEKAIRAVATANGANAISIIIPCHRIIGSTGEMVGYAGGKSTKMKLLELEHNNSSQSQTKLF